MKNQMKKILLAVAMVVVVAAGLLVYSSGKTTSMGTAKGFGGDVTGYPDPCRRQDHRLHRRG